MEGCIRMKGEISMTVKTFLSYMTDESYFFIHNIEDGEILFEQENLCLFGENNNVMIEETHPNRPYNVFPSEYYEADIVYCAPLYCKSEGESIIPMIGIYIKL